MIKKWSEARLAQEGTASAVLFELLEVTRHDEFLPFRNPDSALSVAARAKALALTLIGGSSTSLDSARDDNFLLNGQIASSCEPYGHRRSGGSRRLGPDFSGFVGTTEVDALPEILRLPFPRAAGARTLAPTSAEVDSAG